ncbi:MAG: SGNH/GDSL hydrolase family protein [Gaiellales bacterium]
MRSHVRGFARTAAVVGVVATSGCLDSDTSPTHRRAAAPEAVWNIVALGDSDATGEGDGAGLGWVGRYARLVRQRLGVKVVVTNLARSGQTTWALATALRSDPSTQGAVAKAQIVVLGVGRADLARGDARLEAGTCKAEACYAADLFEFRGNIELVAALVRHVLESPDVTLRAITLPNVITGAIGVDQSKSLRRSICRAMAMYRGRCVDVFRAFNGRTGTQNASARGWLTTSPCCHPTAAGHQVIAELVLKTGFGTAG